MARALTASSGPTPTTIPVTCCFASQSAGTTTVGTLVETETRRPFAPLMVSPMVWPWWLPNTIKSCMAAESASTPTMSPTETLAWMRMSG